MDDRTNSIRAMYRTAYQRFTAESLPPLLSHVHAKHAIETNGYSRNEIDHAIHIPGTTHIFRHVDPALTE